MPAAIIRAMGLLANSAKSEHYDAARSADGATVTHDSKATLQTPLAGIVLLLAAATLWSLSGALIKMINSTGLHAVTIAFYRSLFAGLFLLPAAWGRFHTLRSKPRKHDQTKAPNSKTEAPTCEAGAKPLRRVLLLPFDLRPAATACVLFFTLMTVCFVYANTRTEAANVIILQYTSTFWIFGLSPLVLKEKPGSRDVWILAVAMIGIGIIFAGRATTAPVALTMALSSGLFFALLTMMIRRMRDSDPSAVIVLNLLGSAALLLPAAYFMGLSPSGAETWLLLIAMGVVQFGLPYYLYALALRRVAAYKAGLLTLIEPVLVPLWTYLAVRETIPVTTAIGGGVILFALVLFLRRAGRRTHRVKDHRLATTGPRPEAAAATRPRHGE